MIKNINGLHFRNLIDYGIRNLSLYREHVNSLNTFPVPDGDTGTNMVMTLRNGFAAIEGQGNNLSELAKKFVGAIIFGARGNSGVIISQFFKGFAECFYEKDEADCVTVTIALERGVEHAYHAVAHPTEGTVLTVLREATEYVRAKLEEGLIGSIDDTVQVFLERAQISLEHTPDLLPVLKSAGVVDSGGAGIIYVFSGMKKYLCGEQIEKNADKETVAEQVVDYSRFNRESKFEYGYCTELLLQTTSDKSSLDYDSFKAELNKLGESIIISNEGDKFKIHIHTKKPEEILSYCHNFGEFLSLKIENMSVQHEDASNIIEILSETPKGEFAVVAVAHDISMKRRFAEMGADVVITGNNNSPLSASDFVKAYMGCNAKQILVFANEKKTELTAMQAAKLYNKADITVVETHSDAECYLTLPMIDFETENAAVVAEALKETMDNIRVVTVYAVTKPTKYEGKKLSVGDFVSFADNKLISITEDLDCAIINTIFENLHNEERDVVTLFAGCRISKEIKDKIRSFMQNNFPFTEFEIVETEQDVLGAIISFE